MKSFIVDKNGKLSKLATLYIEDITFSALRDALKKKDVKVNGKRISKDISLNVGDKVEIYYTPNKTVGYTTLFSDQNVVVINKKSGYTSENVYAQLLSEFDTAKFIHRLDRNTSGLMIFALNDVAEKELLDGFKKHTFNKIYRARVKGTLQKKKDIVIGR